MNQVKMSAALFLCAGLSVAGSFAQSGCTDPLASNYNATATVNDGSCLYAVTTATPVISFPLSDSLAETSGLIFYNGNVWSHNDNTDIHLYALDTATGAVTGTCAVAASGNEDWEEITQDSAYIYIGDFGNNVNGNRTNLHILRVLKDSICTAPAPDTIWFSYPDQTDFTATGANNTDFDCEAFAATADSIYLFTKQWVSLRTKVYALPKTPGVYVAELRDSFDAAGLITGAALRQEDSLLVLCGYSSLLQPFLWLLYDFHEHHFFSGNKRKVGLSTGFHQVEGICTEDGLTYYVSNERFVNVITTEEKLNRYNLTSLLGGYLSGGATAAETANDSGSLSIFPNPVQEVFHVSCSGAWEIIDVQGKIWKSGEKVPVNGIEVSMLPFGVYVLRTAAQSMRFVKD